MPVKIRNETGSRKYRYLHSAQPTEMEKPVYESAEEAKEAIVKMEKARLLLFNNGMLSQKYNKLLKKRIWKLVKDHKIDVSDLLAAYNNP